MVLRQHAVLVVSLLGALLACAGGGTRPPRPIASDLGTYRFEERVAGEGGSSVVIQGVFTVRPDTIIVVDATPGPCEYDRHSTRGGALAYNCADVVLRFDRDDPVGRSMYLVTVLRVGRRTVCVRYETNSTGQRVCAEQKVEETESSVQRSGRLNARPVL